MSRFLFIAALWLSAFIFFLVTAAQAADDVLENFKKPMPELQIMSPEEFEAKTELHEISSNKDQTLSYHLRLPAGWQEAEQSDTGNFLLDNKLFEELGRYYGPVRPMGDRSRLTVEALKLDYRLTAEQWLLQHLLANGYTIQGIKTYSDDKTEAAYVLIERNVSFVVRSLALINGKNLVLVNYYLPMENWEEEKVMQAQVIQSFGLQNEQKEIIEKMAQYRFLDIARLQYPESWELRTKSLRSIDRMSADFLSIKSFEQDENITSYLSGKMTANLVSTYVAQSIEDEIKDLKQSFADEGLLLKEPVESDLNVKFHDLFEFGHVEAYEAIDKENDLITYEVWMAVALAGDYYYFVTLLTPSRKQDYYTWSKNTQTFKVFLELIEPLEESLIEQ